MENEYLQSIVDPKYSAEQSILLRYQKSGIGNVDEDAVKAVSLKEGARILHVLDYKGVPVHVLDETTLTETNTFEAYVAAVTIAHCRQQNHRKIMFSSGGNLGSALAAYAHQAGIEAYSFHPSDNIPFLNGEILNQQGIHAVGVREAQKTREMVLKFRERMIGALGYDPLVPSIEERLEAFQYRGFFVSEHMLQRQMQFESVAQTVSAGFGPLGMYRTLSDLVRRNILQALPKFLGIQQEANCYMFERWRGQKVAGDISLLAPTLFDKNPDKTFGTYAQMADLIRNTQGLFLTINHRAFERYISPDVRCALAMQGIQHATSSEGQILAKSGLLGFAGTLKAIDEGFVQQGPSLVCMTDGVKAAYRPAKIEFEIREEGDIEKLVERAA